MEEVPTLNLNKIFSLLGVVLKRRPLSQRPLFHAVIIKKSKYI